MKSGTRLSEGASDAGTTHARRRWRPHAVMYVDARNGVDALRQRCSAARARSYVADGSMLPTRARSHVSVERWKAEGKRAREARPAAERAEVSAAPNKRWERRWALDDGRSLAATLCPAEAEGQRCGCACSQRCLSASAVSVTDSALLCSACRLLVCSVCPLLGIHPALVATLSRSFFTVRGSGSNSAFACVAPTSAADRDSLSQHHPHSLAVSAAVCIGCQTLAQSDQSRAEQQRRPAAQAAIVRAAPPLNCRDCAYAPRPLPLGSCRGAFTITLV